MPTVSISAASKIHPGRLAGLAKIFVHHGCDFWKNSKSLFATAEADDTTPRRSIGKDLENLGPTFVKFGQLLSTRPDLVPPHWLESLENLQDGGKEVPFETIRNTIESDLGVRISKAFSSFDEKPLACASLAQVHRATLRKNNRPVVVKVRRPDAPKSVENDLETIEGLFDLLGDDDDESGSRKRQLCLFVEQFRRTLLDELNYPLEARNLSSFQRNLRAFPNVVIPSPIPGYCGDEVLTMDEIEGENVTSLSPLVLMEPDVAPLADEAFRAYLKQILNDGVFHADPHPGNILLTPDHKLAFLDLGMVGRLNRREQDRVLALLLSIAENDELAVARDAERLGEPTKAFNRNQFLESITRVVSINKNRSVGDLEVGSLVMEVTNAATASGLLIPRSISLLGKTLLNLDRIGSALDPGFNPAAVIREVAPGFVTKRITTKIRSTNVLGFLNESEETLGQLPHRLNEITTQLQDGRFRLDIDAVDEESLIKGIHKIANRITVGIIVAAMIIGAAMLMNVDTPFTLFGYPGLAILLFLFAAATGSVLVFRILTSNAQ